MEFDRAASPDLFDDGPPMREVRVYDGDFSALERILAGDPTADFPKEIWLQQVRPGEFAVRYKDFKTGLARNPAGERVTSSEVCRIFESLEEARANSREVVNDHWTVRCFIYDHSGAQAGTISNNKEVSKYSVLAYGGTFLWLCFFAIGGMVFIWLVSKIALAVLGPFPSVRKSLPSFGWAGWTAYAIAGLALGILACYQYIQIVAKRRVDRLHSKLKSIITPEEENRFEELNTLFGSSDPAQRDRFLKLSAEYQQKAREAMKK